MDSAWDSAWDSIFTSCWQNKKKDTDLEESTLCSASTLRDPSNNLSDHLTVGSSLLALYAAWQTTHEEDRIWSDSKMSRASRNSGQKKGSDHTV